MAVWVLQVDAMLGVDCGWCQCGRPAITNDGGREYYLI